MWYLAFSSFKYRYRYIFKALLGKSHSSSKMPNEKRDKKRKPSKDNNEVVQAGSPTKQAKVSTSQDKTGNQSTKSSQDRLQFSFYDKECTALAKSLLGQTLVCIVDGQRLAGKIVETESYFGPEDKADPSYKGKRTARTGAMFMPPGTAYVYNIYGIYCCLNIATQGDGSAVLLRALQPLENLPIMDKYRTGESGKSLMKNYGKDLCNGPSKLCRALAITKASTNQVDMCTSDTIWLEKGETVQERDIVNSKRINIPNSGEEVDKLLRFYVLGNKCVSVRDKEAEKLMQQTD